MARENIGEVNCAFCGAKSQVRKSDKGKLYYSCATDGLVMPLLPGFQSWMMEHANIWGADRAARQAAAQEPDTGTPAPTAPIEASTGVDAAAVVTAKKKKVVGVGMFRREVEE